MLPRGREEIARPLHVEPEESKSNIYPFYEVGQESSKPLGQKVSRSKYYRFDGTSRIMTPAHILHLILIKHKHNKMGLTQYNHSKLCLLSTMERYMSL